MQMEKDDVRFEWSYSSCLCKGEERGFGMGGLGNQWVWNIRIRALLIIVQR